MKRAAVALAIAGSAFAGCGDVPLDAVAIDPGTLSRELVAHWAFDQITGTVVSDGSGNHHDVAGFPQATASWTVSVWTRASADDLAASTTDLAPVVSAETQFAGGWQINLDNRADQQRYLAAYWPGAGGNDYVRVYCSCVDADRWIHLTAVWEAERTTVSLYRDEQRVGQTRMPNPISPGDTTLYMGTWNQLNRFFVGDVDDLAIWRRALQPVEIATLSREAAGI